MVVEPHRPKLSDTPWALTPDALSRIVAWSRSPSDQPLALGGQHAAPTARQGTIVVLPVYGVIEHRSDALMAVFGGTSVESLRSQLREAMADPDVQAVILDIDSPGGAVAGMTELAADVRAARGSKPIVAVANTLAASAAYWLATQADEVVVTPSGSVGSVGVYAVHQEASRALDEAGITTTIVSAGPHKMEGNEFEPLSDEARASLQERVDTAYAQFVGDVAAGRGLTRERVEADFGGGRVVTSEKAMDAGMVDRVETLDQTIRRLGTSAGRRRAMSAESLPFTSRVSALAEDADELIAHARERVRLRAKEGRSLSPSVEDRLRSIRASLDGLLDLDDPGTPPEAPADPAPTVVKPPVVVAPPSRSRTDWLAAMENR